MCSDCQVHSFKTASTSTHSSQDSQCAKLCHSFIYFTRWLTPKLTLLLDTLTFEPLKVSLIDQLLVSPHFCVRTPLYYNTIRFRDLLLVGASTRG